MRCEALWDDFKPISPERTLNYRDSYLQILQKNYCKLRFPRTSSNLLVLESFLVRLILPSIDNPTSKWE